MIAILAVNQITWDTCDIVKKPGTWLRSRNWIGSYVSNKITALATLYCMSLQKFYHFCYKQKLTEIQFQLNIGYLHTGTISYCYRTGLIFGKEKLTVNTGPVRYRTSFGTSSHGYVIVLFRSILLQTSKRKFEMSTKFQTLPPNKE